MSGFLLPVDDDELTQPFWDGCRRGQLLVQRFKASGHLVWPPRPMDPATCVLEYEWEQMSGRGTIWSFVVPHPPLLPAYAEVAPYNVIVVALDEDPTIRMVGNLVATPEGLLNEVDPHSIQVGEAVRVVFSPVDDIVLPRWVRA